MKSQSSTARKTWRVAGVLTLAAITTGAIALTRSQEQMTPERETPTVKAVRVAAVEQQTMPLRSEYRGELVAEAAEIAAQGAGRLLAVRKELGDQAKKGELLAEVDASESARLLSEANAQLQSAQASQKRVEAELKAAELELQRAENLQAEGVASEQEVANLESRVAVLAAEKMAALAAQAAARARVSVYGNQVSQSRLVAPFESAVAARYLDPGSTVSPGTPVLRLVKKGPLRVRFRVSEQHLSRVKEGSPFTLVTLATGDQRFEGQVERIGAEVSRGDRSAAAEGILDSTPAALKPGMYAVVDVELGVLENALTIPSEAVLTKLDPQGTPEHGVKIVKDGKAEYVRVDVLGEHEGRSAITGLSPEAMVIIFGQESVVDGSPVRAVNAEAP